MASSPPLSIRRKQGSVHQQPQYLASEMLMLGFRQTQEITVALDALIITKIGKAMQMGSMVKAHFCPETHLRVKIMIPSESSRNNLWIEMPGISRGNLTDSPFLHNLKG